MAEPRSNSVAGGIAHSSPMDPSGAFGGADQGTSHVSRASNDNQRRAQHTDDPPGTSRDDSRLDQLQQPHDIDNNQDDEYENNANENIFESNSSKYNPDNDSEEDDDFDDKELLEAVAALGAGEDMLTRELSRVIDSAEFGVDSKRQNSHTGKGSEDTTGKDFGPFAERTGHTLSWTKVNMEVKTQTGQRTIVKDLEGVVLPGELTAIMGHRYDIQSCRRT